MPYEMFVELLSNEKVSKSAYDEISYLMRGITAQNPNDKRYLNTKLCLEHIVSSVTKNRSVLATKMVSLEVLFPNLDYFNEICELYSKKDIKTGETSINYEEIARVYETTSDNVKSNILYNNFKETINTNKNTRTR